MDPRMLEALAAAMGGLGAMGGAGGRRAHLDLGKDYVVDLGKELGRGSFGTVYRGRHKQNKGVVAIKRLRIPNDEKGAEAMKEIKNFQKLEPHENIIYLYDFHYREQCFWMIMEFCNGGDLNDFMKKPENARSWDVKYDIMIQCAAGLAHMHCQSTPIVHRDIKPANILMKLKDGQNIVKITDFGLSKMVDPTTMVHTAMFTTVCGTPGYMAPELFMKVEYGPAVDVFAIGLVYIALIYYIETGDMLPLSATGRKSRNVVPIGQEMVMHHQLNQPMPTIVEDSAKDDLVQKQLKQLVRNMTCFTPSKRHSMRIVEQEMARIFNRSYVPRKVKSGMPLFNRRAEEEELPDTANEGGAGAEAAAAPEVGFQLIRDALESRRDARLEGMEEGEAAREKERLDGMNVVELMGALVDSDEGSADKFELGDRVRVKPDVSVSEAQKLQQGHGEWSQHMAKYFGQVGYVKQSSATKVVVKFKDGETWIWNPKLVEKYSGPEPNGGLVSGGGRHAAVAGLFHPNDVVKTPADKDLLRCLQEVIGMKWTDKMERCVNKTGIVHKIDRDGDVVVELVNGLSGPFNPEALTHVRHEGEVVIEAGDMVMVKQDREEVKGLQEGHGGWHSDMAQALGKAGIVQKVQSNRALVEVGHKTWHFNTAALLLVIKGDELFAELRREKP